MMRRVLFVISICLPIVSFALEPSPCEKLAITKKAWMVARSHRYGILTPVDLQAAKSWQNLYIELLPKDYPQKSKLHLSGNGSSNAKKSYQKQVNFLHDKYHIHWQLKDKDLKYQKQCNSFISKKPAVAPVVTYHNLNEFLIHVKAYSPALYQKYQWRYKAFMSQSEKGLRLVYGVVRLEDVGYDPNIVGTLPIDAGGFFMAETKENTGYFAHNQYIKQPLDWSKSTANIVRLNPMLLKKSQKHLFGSLVGQLSPKLKQSTQFILLTEPLKAHADLDLWKKPLYYLTRLPNGQFYIRDLSPGKYQLMIAHGGKVTQRNVMIRAGEVKSLGRLTT